MRKENMNEQINELIDYSKRGILSKVIIKNDKMNVTLFCMAENTEISEHTSTKQGFVYVIEGKGIFTLEEKKIEMLPGVFIQMNENQVHSIQAQANTSFMLVLT